MSTNHDPGSGKFLPGNKVAAKAVDKKRDRSVSEIIRHETREGKELVRKLLAMMRSKDKAVTISHKIQIAQVLMDRAWGKPSQHRTLDKRTINVKVELPADLIDTELPRRVTQGSISIVK